MGFTLVPAEVCKNLCFTPSLLFLCLSPCLLHGWTDRLAELRTTGWVCFFRHNSSPSQREKKKIARVFGKSSQKIPSFQQVRPEEKYTTFGSSFPSVVSRKAQGLLYNKYETARGFTPETDLTPNLSHCPDNQSDR